MTDRLDEIRKRLEAATPGPWHSMAVDPIGRCAITQTLGNSGPPRIATVHNAGLPEVSINTAEFIAHAPSDIAYLLEEVERLGAALDRLASNEAFIESRVATDEERARMEYAEEARDGTL